MGLFDVIFKNRPKTQGKTETVFKMLNGYTPHFTSYNGSIYEQELIRAAINVRATHTAKLKVELGGSARPALQNKLKHGPNQFQTWYQFLYRLSTILDVHNTAFICPVYDQYGEPSGVVTPLPQSCEIVAYNDIPYLRYTFRDGKRAAVELEYCGIMTKHQYKSDFFGETNSALYPTIDLIHIQNQGIQEGVKSAAHFRFWAQVNNFTKADDLKKERTRFSEENFGKDAEAGGLLLFPNTYSNINQIKADPWVVSAEEEKIIKENVFDYFNVNEELLQSAVYGDKWVAAYEGICEPFAIQFSEGLTKAIFSERERATGSHLIANANRLQYMTTTAKVQLAQQMLDRGVMSINEARELFNYAPVDGGEVRTIRGEYKNADGADLTGGNENANENE